MSSQQSMQRLNQAIALAERMGYRVEMDPDPAAPTPNAFGSFRLVEMRTGETDEPEYGLSLSDLERRVRSL